MTKREAPRFTPRLGGGFEEPVAGLEPDKLRGYLPAVLRAHAGAAGFLADVQDAATTVAAMAADAPDSTADEVRDQVQAIEVAARRMQAALTPLTDASHVFECLDAHAEYLLLRTREVGMPTVGRPVVPTMDTTAPDFAGLLQRLHGDLAALRVACNHTADQITPQRGIPKGHELHLAKCIVAAFQRNFGRPPPGRRSWFADEFMAYIGETMGMKIGHRLIDEAKASLGE
jgi:hypothetical protein